MKKLFKQALILCIVFLGSCTNQTQKNGNNLITENNTIPNPLNRSKVSSEIYNCGFQYIKIKDRTYNRNSSLERYEAGGVYNIENDYVDIEIPVSTTDFDLCDIKKNIVTTIIKKNQALVISLTNGKAEETDLIPTYVIKGKIKFSSLGLEISTLGSQKDSAKVYVINDLCFQESKKDILKALREDLKSYYKRRHKGVLEATKQKIRDITDSCDSIKPFDKMKPKESGGGVITGE